MTSTTDPAMVPVIAERDRLRAENQQLRDALEQIQTSEAVGDDSDYEVFARSTARSALAGTPSEDTE